MNADDKKRAGVVILALAAGLIAAILMSNHIRNETAVRAKEYEEKTLIPLKKQLDDQNKQLVSLQRDLQEMPKKQATVAAGPKEGASSQASLSEKTPVGKRAITVEISSLDAVGGLVNPGDYVDVLARLAVPRRAMVESKKDAQNVTTVVFQNVQVLAVGPNVDNPGSYVEQQKAKSLVITLALNPDEAGLMSFIEQGNGELKMFLRSPSETQTYILQASNWQSLADYVKERQGVDINPPAPPPVSAQAAEEKPYIQIFKGGQEL